SDSTAVAGKYNVVVNKLATGSKIASASFAGGAASAIPSGTLKITQNGVAQEVSIDQGSTLEQARDKINSTLQGKGITANIINDTSGARLVFSSTTTGKGRDISVEG
ncbi:flagellin hook IN motif-containing protein, partial [Pseudomonas viridiflava]|uniref:flagellin hook IN motif-containing protein n=1 Tax=Pseudomonas viridiflava TaxID=33069 RepID=UPI0023F6E110